MIYRRKRYLPVVPASKVTMKHIFYICVSFALSNYYNNFDYVKSSNMNVFFIY